MKNISTAIILIVIAIVFFECSSTYSDQAIPYPSPKPDSTALTFMPGIVSSDSLDFNLAYSPDAQTIYFSRSRKGKWIILQSSFDGHTWSLPKQAPFSENEYSQADPFVTTDGSIYYISNRPRDEGDSLPDFDIWFVKPLGNDSWSAPTNVEIVNTDSAEYYVSITPKRDLYFASNRPGGYGQLDLYVSRFIDGNYTSPVNLGAGVNTENDEHDPLTMGDEEFIIFNGSNRTDSFGEADLYFSTKLENGEWSNAKNMGSVFNTPTYEYCPNLSPDSKYFFYSSEYNVKWISSEYLPFKLK